MPKKMRIRELLTSNSSTRSLDLCNRMWRCSKFWPLSAVFLVQFFRLVVSWLPAFFKINLDLVCYRTFLSQEDLQRASAHWRRSICWCSCHTSGFTWWILCTKGQYFSYLLSGWNPTNLDYLTCPCIWMGCLLFATSYLTDLCILVKLLEDYWWCWRPRLS